MARETLQDLTPRLKAAARDVADAKAALKLATEQRDQLVAQAVDEGMAHRAVAAAIGVSVARVTPILIGVHSEPAA